MKKKKTGWLVLGIISSISAAWMGLCFAGMLFFLLFLRSSGTIDGQSFRGGIPKDQIFVLVFFVSATLLSAVLAICGFVKYNKSGK